MSHENIHNPAVDRNDQKVAATFHDGSEYEHDEQPTSDERYAADAVEDTAPVSGWRDLGDNGWGDRKGDPQAIQFPDALKSAQVAMVLFFFFSFIGVHQFYLRRPGRAISYIFTLGWGTVGVWIDLFTLMSQVARANTKIQREQLRKLAR